jgi:hypothetical protein
MVDTLYGRMPSAIPADEESYRDLGLELPAELPEAEQNYRHADEIVGTRSDNRLSEASSNDPTGIVQRTS